MADLPDLTPASPHLTPPCGHSTSGRAKLGSFCTFCLRHSSTAGIFQSAIYNPQSAIARAPGPQIGFVLHDFLRQPATPGPNWVRFAQFDPEIGFVWRGRHPGRPLSIRNRGAPGPSCLTLAASNLTPPALASFCIICIREFRALGPTATSIIELRGPPGSVPGTPTCGRLPSEKLPARRAGILSHAEVHEGWTVRLRRHCVDWQVSLTRSSAQDRTPPGLLSALYYFRFGTRDSLATQ
jgi:hypothetical protein